MSEQRVDWRRDGFTVLSLFLLLMVRACAAGVQYWPQLDDYIQYHNYAAAFSFAELQETVGVLASRPLAGLADYFLWSPLFSNMILGVALVSLLYAVTALLLKNQLERYFRVGPLFLVIFTLLPLGVEGTYWMSASTRVVCGLFFSILAAEVFLRWVGSGKWIYALVYLPLQLLPFGFYEQSGVFSVTLVIGFGILEYLRDHKCVRRAVLSLWGVPAMGIYLLLTKLLLSGSVYAGRTELCLPAEPGWWSSFLPEVLRQMKAVFLEGNFYILAKGFLRTAREILSGELLLWAVAVTVCVFLFWRAVSGKKEQEGKRLSPWLAVTAGVLLFAAPISIFFVLAEPWFSFRGAVTSFAGLALLADTAVMGLWRRLPGFRRGPEVLAAFVALVFVLAGGSEIRDYRQTYEYDQRLGRMVVDAVQEELPPDSELSIGVLGLEASFLPNQNYYYHEHIHGCTESAWAFQGLLTCLDGERTWRVTPLPSAPVYRKWNAETNRPENFDILYWYDGSALRRVTLEKTGIHDFTVLDAAGSRIGALWEEADGLGYFRPYT